jgi:hypothetical protein
MDAVRAKLKRLVDAQPPLREVKAQFVGAQLKEEDP